MDSLKSLILDNFVTSSALTDTHIELDPDADFHATTRCAVLGAVAPPVVGCFLGHSCVTVAAEAVVGCAVGAQLGHHSFRYREDVVKNQPLRERISQLEAEVRSCQAEVSMVRNQNRALERHVRDLQDNNSELRRRAVATLAPVQQGLSPSDMFPSLPSDEYPPPPPYPQTSNN